MQTDVTIKPWWAGLTVWGVVNAVNLLQAVGFYSRVHTGSRAINHRLGRVIIALGVPAAVALFAFLRARVGWLQWAGPAIFLTFIVLELAIDYVWPVEFRSPARPSVLVPYLLLFFGSILLMGLPMFRANRQLWLVTVATTTILLVSMIVAMRQGVA
jgi:phosphatidylserine synthase